MRKGCRNDYIEAFGAVFYSAKNKNKNKNKKQKQKQKQNKKKTVVKNL